MSNLATEDTLRMSLMRMSILMLSMQHFSVEIIRHFTAGDLPNERTFDQIQKDTIRDLKSSAFAGVTIAQQAELLKECNDAVRALMTGAITLGTAHKNQ